MNAEGRGAFRLSGRAIRNWFCTPGRRAAVIVIAIAATAFVVPSAIGRVNAAFEKDAKTKPQRKRAAASRTARPAGGTATVRQAGATKILSESHTNPDGTITAGQMLTDLPVERTSSDIMTEQFARPSQEGRLKPERELVEPDRRGLPQAPGALEVAQWPPDERGGQEKTLRDIHPSAPQTLGTAFDGATGPSETGAFPPDTMGAVGPTQVFVFLNGRLRTFNKTTGAADGFVNADPDVFFSSVETTPGAGEGVFTSDPQVRFDRLSNRWFLVIIDVIVNGSGQTTKANRVLIAVSDAASNGSITAGTVWTFYQFQGDATLFTDYESLGIDANALYIGADMFTLAGAFNSTKGFAVPKAPLLTGSTATVWSFANLATSGNGPFAPRGVDNYDPNNTGPSALGYIIGVDNAAFGALSLRRITNPASLSPAPTMSANILITVSATAFPFKVPHLGNTGGTNGQLDGLDDRLYAAHLRNGRLWTAHNIGVNSSGVASAATRNGVRWYELQNLSTTPAVVQSGTLFDTAATNPRFYWIPSFTVSGQGHAAMGCSIAGNNERINAFTTGRLVGDTLGTLRDGPGTPAGYTATSTAYNPASDPGGTGGRRWGDYSFTSLDPKDDMTMWTIQEYCNGANSYGARAVKLIAPPPPPTNSASPGSVPLSNPSINIVVTGTAPAGQGFYDPGTNPASPHTPFNHISASGPGLTVNSVTFTDATHVTLNISTVGSTSGTKTVTITNPDGQTTTVNITLGPTEAKVDKFTASGFDSGQVLISWRTNHEVNNLGYNVYRESFGQKTKITPQIIAGSALTVGNGVGFQAGNSYVWSDQPTTGFGSVKYWLESVDLGGTTELTGPISITKPPKAGPVKTEQSALLGRLGMAQAQLNLQSSAPVQRVALQAAATPAEVQQQNFLAGQAAMKLSVKQEGWYRVTQSDLVAAGMSPSIDPRSLQMFVGGRQVPIIVNGEQNGRFDAADSIEFYGLGLGTAASDTRVYWLTTGTSGGMRIKSLRAMGTPGTASFQYAVERKDRTIYFSALRNGDEENFFGPVVTPIGVDQVLALTKLAPAPPSNASLDVSVQGVTLGTHQLKVQLNGADIGTMTFADQNKGTQSFSIAQSRLREGSNTVRLISLISSGDISLVDTVRVTYWHSYAADNNQLNLSATGGQEVNISGFATSDIRVVDVTDPFTPLELIGVATGGKGNFTQRVALTGVGVRSVMAFTGDRAKRVADISRNNPSNWRQPTNAADLVLITRREFMSSVSPLVNLRQSQGLRVALVDVEDLFDEFNFGNKSPQAIKDFLTLATSSWATAPRFVLIVGDASYDPKNYLGAGNLDFVPTKLIDTAYMEAASDDWMADFDGDGIPELAVGRLPARNAAEAAALVARVVAYESAAPSASVVLASDSDNDFISGSAALKALIPANLSTSEFVRGTVDDATLKAQLLASLNSGPTLVNYMGHGSVNLWRGSVLTNDDALVLTNGNKTPVFVLMTCLNGYFDDPAIDSLGEALMRAPNGGAIAVWASSSMCDAADQGVLNREFYRQLFGGQQLTVGQAAQRAKAAVHDLDVRRTWVLLGDPTVKVRMQ